MEVIMVAVSENDLLPKIAAAEAALDFFHSSFGSDNSTRAIGSFAEHQLANPEEIRKDLANKVSEQITESVVLLLDKFSLAQVFADTADNMRLVDKEEAYAIVSATEKIESFFNYSAIILAAAGGIMSLTTTNTNAVNGAMVFSVISAALGGVFRTKGAGQQSTQSTKAIEGVLKYAHSKAEALSVHSYLSIELTSMAEATKSISNDLKKIISMTSSNEDEVKALAQAYVAVIKSIDGLYDYQLAKTQITVSGRADSPIYTEDTQKKLSNLADTVQQSRNNWTNARYFYARSEKNAIDYLAKVNNSNL
jgi:hypothetical protein